MEQKYILALEIGSSKVKGAVGMVDEDGILTINAVEEERILESVRHGMIINVETVASKLTGIIRKLENRVSPRKACSVYVGIGGRSLRSSAREVERQLPIEQEITAELIDQMRDEALATALSDREVVAVSDGEYYVDGRQCANPVGTFGRNVHATFNLITCSLQIKRNIKRVIEDRLKLKINDCIVRQLAEGELVLSSDERRQGCMLVDMGAETTTVSIYRYGYLTYMATIPMGSRNITRDIMALNYLEERAEEIKKAGGNAMPFSSNAAKQIVDGLDYSEINNYVHARSCEIIANILEQISYAELKPTDLPGGIVMVGLGAKLKGLNELMAKVSKMKVRAGGTPFTVRIGDTRIDSYVNIDVISILAAAAKLPNVQECMTQPATVAPPVVEPAKEVFVEAEAEEDEPLEQAEAEFKGRLEDEDEDYDIPAEKKPRWQLWRKVGKKITDILSEDDDDDFYDADER